ncbi:MAG: carbohydrate ABC transporter permease [Psychrilyobacter sp.]|uniref:carbohydrate ABC transporter permease n=1 Tax=Psychrilyobacter sp. TaxID=2586924 RepID=UPI003C790B9C
MIKNKKISSVLIHTLMFGLALSWLYPYAWMFVSSFKKTDEIFNTSLFGGSYTLWNYNFLLESAEKMQRPFLRALGNSVFIAIIVTFTVLITSAIVAYALTKMEFKGREKIKSFILFQMVFPSFMFIIPMYVLIRQLGLINTYSALIIPSLMSGWGIFMMSQSFKGTPNDYIEAAKIDGAGDLWIIFKLMIPLNKSIVAIVAIFTFTGVWDNFMWPLIVMQDFNKMPLSVLLATFSKAYGVYVGPVLAGSVIQTIPMLLLFVIFRKHFLEGMSLSLK